MLKKSLKTLAVVMTLIATAKAFAYMMTDLRIPEQITATLLALTHNKMLLLLIINLMLLILGCFMDMAPLIMIMTPILLPVVTSPAIGMHPVHFGVMLIFNLAVGLCTPPVGSALVCGLRGGQNDAGENLGRHAAHVCHDGRRPPAGYLCPRHLPVAARTFVRSLKMIVDGWSVVSVACEEGVSRKVLAWNDDLMMCEISFQAGAKGKVHAHPHTQVSYVGRGSFRFRVGDETKVVRRGDSILIPPNTLHGVEALEEAMLVDVFSPARQDFVQGALM